MSSYSVSETIDAGIIVHNSIFIYIIHIAKSCERTDYASVTLKPLSLAQLMDVITKIRTSLRSSTCRFICHTLLSWDTT